MGMKTRAGLSGGAKHWGQPALSTRRKTGALGQRQAVPNFSQALLFSRVRALNAPRNFARDYKTGGAEEGSSIFVVLVTAHISAVIERVNPAA